MTREDNNKACCSNIPPNATNPVWLIGTTICGWFLLYHGPKHLAKKDEIHPLLYLHLIGAYSIYLACVHNTILTPSTLNGTAKPFHIWVGRIGMMLGIAGFVFGLLLTWFIYDPSKNLSFSIGITAGGIAQLFCQFFGYRSIRKFQAIKVQIEAGEYKDMEELYSLENEQDRQLVTHIENMISLFFLACGIPGLMRLADYFGGSIVALLSLIALAIFLSLAMSTPAKLKVLAKRAAQRQIIISNSQ
mmetsp:Transcript_24670/g.37482  ORF Transcript_24670/g.37482 Transcript_24670/m.37482 type:complete len:246 (-) Transcript_24670:310-1047(-)